LFAPSTNSENLDQLSSKYGIPSTSRALSKISHWNSNGKRRDLEKISLVRFNLAWLLDGQPGPANGTPERH